jgi:hypothetical protein
LTVGFRPYANKAAKNPPSTTIASSVSPETAWQSSRKCRASRKCLSFKAYVRFEPSRCHSNLPLIQCYADFHSSRRTEDRSAGSYQVFQLSEAHKRPVFKDLFRHVNPLEQIIKLFCSRGGSVNSRQPKNLSHERTGCQKPGPREPRLVRFARDLSPLARHSANRRNRPGFASQLGILNGFQTDLRMMQRRK